jgi:hypothetical protein
MLNFLDEKYLHIIVTKLNKEQSDAVSDTTKAK